MYTNIFLRMLLNCLANTYPIWYSKMDDICLAALEYPDEYLVTCISREKDYISKT